MRWSRVRALRRAALFAAFTLLAVPPFLVIVRLSDRWRGRMERYYYRHACRILGVKLRHYGVPHIAGGSSVLYIANHVSYLDIPIIGASLPATFVAKSEIANWPFIGYLSRSRGTAFVRRNSADAVMQRTQLAQRLSGGESLVLFPEGTSSNGSAVLPFKSALFASLYPSRDSLPISDVQPITLAYRADAHGTALDGDARERFAWYGDDDLVPHLWSMLGLAGCTVDVVYHEPIHPEQASDRKVLARQCEATIASTLATALTDGPDALEYDEMMAGALVRQFAEANGQRRRLRLPLLKRHKN